MPFSKDFRVYFADTDAAGVVHHARYICWLEAARIDMLDHLGCSYKSLQDEAVGLVPVDISIQYKQALKFDDRFRVHLSVESLKKASVSIKGDFFMLDTCYATSVVQLACIDETTWKPVGMPARLHIALS